MALATADEFMAELMGAAEVQPKSSLVVRFCIEAQENETKSRAAGRPIFEDVEIIEIHNPGEIDMLRRPVTDRDRLSFPKQYLAFKSSQSQEGANGFPLGQWAQMKRSQVEEARALGIFTIEQLAAVSDGNLQRLGPGWIALRQNARDWEKSAKDGAPLAALRSALEEANSKIKTLEDMLKKQAVELQRDPQTSTGAAVQYAPAVDAQIAEMRAMIEKLAAKEAAPTPTYPAVVVEPPKKIDGRSKAARAAKAAAAKA